MRLVKIIACGLVGLLLGLAWSRGISAGYFEHWELLTPPPSSIVEFIAVGRGSVIARTTSGSILRCTNWRHECWVQDEFTVYHFSGTRVIKPCDFSSSEFMSFMKPPTNITECIQGVSQYAEGVGIYTYVLDRDGNVWEWSHIFAGGSTLFATLAPFCFPTLGLMIGIILFRKKLKNVIE